MHRAHRHRLALPILIVSFVACGGADDDSVGDTAEALTTNGSVCDVCDATPTAQGCPFERAPGQVPCTGPWQIEQVNACAGRFEECGCEVWPANVRHELCGTEEVDVSPSGPSTVWGFNVVEHCIGTNDPPDCSPNGETCFCETVPFFTPSPSKALAACQVAYDNLRATTEAGPDGAFGLDWLPTNSVTVDNQRGDSSSGFEFDCHIVAEYTIWGTCDNAECEMHRVCGECQQYKTCPAHDEDQCGSSITYRLLDEPRDELMSALCGDDAAHRCLSSLKGAECVTADDVVPPIDKAEQLISWLESPELGAVIAADADAHGKLIRALQLLYEFRGGEFTPHQRTEARQTYFDHPAALTCGNQVDAPLLGLCRTAEPVLQYCARMTGAHVDEDLLWGDAEHQGTTSVPAFCAALVGGLDAHSCPAAVIDEGFAVSRALLDQLGQSFQRAFETPRCNQADSEARVAAAARMLAFIGQWHHAVAAIADPPAPGVRVSTARLDDELIGVLTDLWSRIDAAVGFTAELLHAIEHPRDTPPPLCPEEESDILAMLARTARRAVEADQDLVTGGMSSLDGLPLLALFGQIAQSEIARLESQQASHDLACRFSVCKQPNSPPDQTQVAYLYRLLSLFDRVSDGASPGPDGDPPEDLRDALDDSRRPNTGWHTSFAAVEADQRRILDALGAAVGGTYDPEGLDAIDLEGLPRSSRTFLESLRLAKTRYRAYAASGSFTPQGGNYLLTPVYHERRQAIAAELGSLVGDLDRGLQNFEAGIADNIRDVVNATDNRASIERLSERRAQLYDELDLIDGKRDAHARAARGEDISDQIKRAWVDVNGMLESGGVPVQFIQIEQQPASGVPIEVTGADAPENQHAASILDLAVAWNSGDVASSKITASPGEIVSVSVPSQEQWAPKCALQRARVVDESGSQHSLVAPLTGPGGYFLSEQSSSFSAASDSSSESRTSGFRSALCMGANPAVPIINLGVKAEACDYSDQSITTTSVETTASENRTSASFHGGFYLPGLTPFVAPVGSLLVVEMPAGLTSLSHVRDVHVVRSPSSTIVVRDDTSGNGSDFYLVVNDALSHCTATGTQPDALNDLEVTLLRLQSQQAQAEQTLDAMGDVIAYMRSQEVDLVKQGEILPHQLELITVQARGLLPASVRSVASYPPALGQVFDGLIIAERSRLEHAVKLANLDEGRDRIIGQLNLLRTELAYAESTGTLLRALPRWSARNLDLDRMRDRTDRLTEFLADFAFPVIETWYPDLLDALQNDPQVGAALDVLANQEPGTSLYTLAESTHTVAEFIVAGLPNANLVGSWGQTLVGLSFRRPGTGPFDPVIGPPGGPATAYHRADPARANAVWSAIEEGRPQSIHIRPEDLYRAGGGAARLSCDVALPVVRQIGVALVGDEFIERTDTGRLGLTIDLVAEREQIFAGPYGPLTYDLAGYLRTIPLTSLVEAQVSVASRGYPEVMVDAAWAHRGTSDPIGKSPFGTFVFDVNEAVSTDPNAILTPDDIDAATELVIIMRVEYAGNIPSSLPGNPPISLTWIPTCTNEICDDGFDNDTDGLLDCADPICAGEPLCRP